MGRVDLSAPNPASVLMAESWTLFDHGHHLAAVASARMLFESVLRNALGKPWRGGEKSGVVPLLDAGKEARRLSRSTYELVRSVCRRLSELMHGRPAELDEIADSLRAAERQLRRLIQNLRQPAGAWEVAHV